MLSFVEARNAICQHFDAHMMFQEPSIVGVLGYMPEIRMPRIVYKAPIDPSVHWGRLSIQSVMSSQAAFVGYVPESDGAAKRKKYEESGLVFVQLFGPKQDVEAAERQDQLAQIIRAAFRSASIPGKVWFRNARINDLDDEDEMLRLNVVAEYEYNEIA